MRLLLIVVSRIYALFVVKSTSVPNLGWGGGIKPILAMPRFRRRLFRLLLPLVRRLIIMLSSSNHVDAPHKIHCDRMTPILVRLVRNIIKFPKSLLLFFSWKYKPLRVCILRTLGLIFILDIFWIFVPRWVLAIHLWIWAMSVVDCLEQNNPITGIYACRSDQDFTIFTEQICHLDL